MSFVPPLLSTHAVHRGGAELNAALIPFVCLESDFGLLSDFSRAAPQFPNRFFPSDAGFDSDILTVIRTDANTFINNVGSKKTFGTLGGLTPVELGINVFKSLDSSSSLIDPLNPNA